MRALKSIVAATAVLAGLIIPITSSQATDVVTVSPATGTNNSALSLQATAACTGEDASTKVQAFLAGPGFPEAGYSIFNKSAASNVKAGSGYTIPLLETMQSAAAAQTPSATLGGHYTFTVKCYQGLSNTPTETLGAASLWFTSTTAYTTTDPAVATSVALESSATEVSSSQPVTLTATMTPSNAVGSVEFFDGETSIATAAVSGGVASVTHTFSSDLTGQIKAHSITSVFTPTNPLAFTGSTSSAASVRVTTPPGADSVSISPADGTSNSAIDIYTSATCPAAGAATKVQVTMTGAGFPGGKNVTPKSAESSLARSGSGYKTTLSKNMASFAAEMDPVPTLDGEYVFTVKCFEGVVAAPTAVIGSASLWFTSPTVFQTTEPSQGVATSLDLAISPVGSVVAGRTVTYTATVTPAEASGTVRFTATPVSGGGDPIILGDGTLSAGVATVTHSTLAGGSSSGLPKSYRINAAYTSNSENYFDSEAEQKTLVVLAKLVPANSVAPSMSAAKVGTAVTCSVGTWTDAATFTITIKVAGTTVKTGTGNSAVYTPVAANVGKSITCAVAAKSSDNVTTTVNAAAKTVAEGPALKVVTGKAPTITGTVKVGQRLTATRGTWTPAATRYSYQWVTIVGSKATAIAKATGATFTIPASLKGKTIGVIVTAELAGYADGRTTVTAGKVA